MKAAFLPMSREGVRGESSVRILRVPAIGSAMTQDVQDEIA